MNFSTKTSLGLVSLVLLVSCSKPLEMGALVAAEKFELLSTDLKNEGKRIAFDGFVSIGDTSGFGLKTYIDPDNINAAVTLEGYGEGSRLTYIKPSFGKGANQMYFPEKASFEDVLVATNDGKSFQAMKQKFRISATIHLDATKTSQRLISAEGSVLKTFAGEMKLNIPKLMQTYEMTLTDIRFDLP